MWVIYWYLTAFTEFSPVTGFYCPLTYKECSRAACSLFTLTWLFFPWPRVHEKSRSNWQCGQGRSGARGQRKRKQPMVGRAALVLCGRLSPQQGSSVALASAWLFVCSLYNAVDGLNQQGPPRPAILCLWACHFLQADSNGPSVSFLYSVFFFV